MLLLITTLSPEQIRTALQRPDLRMDGKHRYYLGKQLLPNVTSILDMIAKPALVPWAAKAQQEADIEVAWNVHRLGGFNAELAKGEFCDTFRRLAGKEKESQRQAREAADLGKAVHSLIEAWCIRKMGGQRVDLYVSDEAHYVYSGFEEWATDVDLEPVAVETRLLHRGQGYAGTLDCLAYVGGVLTVLDWKSSKAIYPEMKLQSIAYRMAVAEMTGLPLPAGLILRLPKSATDESLKPEPHPVEDDPETLWRAFLNVLELYRWSKSA